MALATKVFSGSRSNFGSTIVYTVPTGRVAKVEFSRAIFNASGTSVFITNAVTGGISLSTNNGSLSLGSSGGYPALPSTTTGPAVQCGINQKIGLLSNTPYIFDVVFYMAAGQDLVASIIDATGNNTGSGSMTYTFIVYEELAG